MNLLIEYCLRTSLVLMLAFAVTRMLRNQPAAFRHVIWMCGFGIVAATPVLLQFGPRILIERAGPPVVVGTASVAEQGREIDLQPPRLSTSRPSPLFSASLFLEIVWMAGVLVVGVRMWRAKRRAHALLKNAIVLKNLSGGGVPVAETDAVATAMTLGVFRPWILLPREHRQWEPELLRAVLLHELAHIGRRDCLVQWLPNVVCAVHWFNPLAWLARSEMLCESERACDDAVIRSGVSGNAFARDLIEIAQSICSKGDSLMSTAVTTKLERRIARLIDPAANREPLTAGRAVLGTAIAVALLAPIAGLRAEQVLAYPVPTVATFAPAAPVPSVKVEALAMTPKRAPRVLAQIAQAQTQAPQPSSTGSLAGVVSDPTGAVVAGATVQVQLSRAPRLHFGSFDKVVVDAAGPAQLSPGTGDAAFTGYSTVTDQTGQWTLAGLAAGMYTVEIQVPGFRAFNMAIALGGGVNVQANAKLRLGGASESVTVSAERPNSSAAPTRQADTPTSSRPLRVSAGVSPAMLIRHAQPVFPPTARDQGIQGSVTLEAIIDKAGFVRDTPLVLGQAPPEFVQAALDAVKQWQYAPARLNGEPVDVLTEITVNFTLQ
jgi:TonB family protein